VTTTGVTTSTTTKATTTTAKVDPADEIRALIKVMNTLTNANTMPTDVYERSFEIMFVSLLFNADPKVFISI
jgi:hypothetical protein